MLAHRIVETILRVKPVSVGLEAGAALVLGRWLQEECARNRIWLIDEERRIAGLGVDAQLMPTDFLRARIHWLKSPAGSGGQTGEAKLRIEGLIP
ncbi:MAG: hypothetical protein NTW86_02420 [Candidatus Sumerlaeota bacterium]|nr:hypothetical protein [Candidatus Sumerlaeota bacterium]